MIREIESKKVTKIIDQAEAKEARRYINNNQHQSHGSLIIGLISLLNFPGSLVIGVAGAIVALAESFGSNLLEEQEDFYTYLVEQLGTTESGNDILLYDYAKLEQKMTYIEAYNKGELVDEGWILDGSPEVIAVHVNNGGGWETF